MQLQKRRDEACGRSRRLQGLDKRGNEQLERCALVLAAANAAGADPFNYDDIGANWMVDGFHSPDCAAGKE
jgi:hypothetical protein